ncbi:MAG: RNA methyltransferase, partial [Firmicutes bacterium]|nr:RNA methyltransferase [Bacillota bacterium]
ADPYAPKVVRAAMGAHATSALFQAAADETVSALRRHGYRVMPAAAVPAGNVGIAADLSGPIALVVGNETQGLSEPFAQLKTFVSLPMPGGGESLNAAIASAVLLYEALRWRGAGVAINFAADV